MADRLIEVIDDRQTGETLLDEALKMMKSSEKYGTGAWVDLMSGESARVLSYASSLSSRSSPTTPHYQASHRPFGDIYPSLSFSGRPSSTSPTVTLAQA